MKFNEDNTGVLKSDPYKSIQIEKIVVTDKVTPTFFNTKFRLLWKYCAVFVREMNELHRFFCMPKCIINRDQCH